jgi:hypothetical protein
MSNTFNCAECGKSLAAHDIRHGWVSVNVGWAAGNARVHTVCRDAFSRRPYDEQVRKMKEVQ